MIVDVDDALVIMRMMSASREDECASLTLSAMVARYMDGSREIAVRAIEKARSSHDSK